MLGLGATTIAFEPLPVNLFYFTSSVLANDRRLRERLSRRRLTLEGREELDTELVRIVGVAVRARRLHECLV